MRSKRIYHFFSLLSLWLYLPASLASPPAYFTRLDSELGLHSNYVNELIQRKDGFVWLATSGGLSRFDGNEVINFVAKPNDSSTLPSSWINTLVEDTQSRLWVGTDIGLARLLPDKGSFRQYLHSSKNLSSIGANQILDIFEDRQQRLWIATAMGLCLYKPESDNFEHFMFDTKVVHKPSVQFIAQSSGNNLWIGGETGLYSFDPDTGEYQHRSIAKLPKNVVFRDAAADSNGGLWLATAKSGVIKYDQSDNQVAQYTHDPRDRNSIASDSNWTILVDDKGLVWVGSVGEGVSKIDPESGIVERYRHRKFDDRTIPHNMTTDLMQDSSGLVWIATYNGVAHYNRNQVIENLRVLPENKSSLNSELVWSFEETENAIWVATTEGLHRWDKNTGDVRAFFSGQHYDDPGRSTMIWVLRKGDKRKLWLGTEFGPALFDIDTFTMRYLHELAIDGKGANLEQVLKKPVWAMRKNVDDSVWIGTNESQLYRVNQRGTVMADYTEVIANSLGKENFTEFTNIYEDNNDNLWLSTSRGFYFLDTRKKIISPVKNEHGQVIYHEDWIYTLQPHQGSQFWVTSQNNGMSLLEFRNDGTVKTHLKIDQDYPEVVDQGIYSVYPVEKSVVWFNGRSNIYKLDLESGKVINFGSRYLPERTIFHENSQFLDERGFLYLGSSQGAIKFRPDTIKKSAYSPKIYLTGIESNSVFMNPGSAAEESAGLAQASYPQKLTSPLRSLTDIEFPYQDNLFKFKFSALDFSMPSNIQYAYRLVGFNDVWTFIEDQRELTFTNLDAGKYQLEIKATNSDLVWGNERAKLSISVLEKPWRTWWAYLGYSFLLSAIFAVSYRFWRRQLLAQNALDDSERQLSQALWGSGDEWWEWDVPRDVIKRKNGQDIFEGKNAETFGWLNQLKKIIHPSDIDELAGKITAIIYNKSSELEAIYRRKTEQGQWIWLLDRAKVTQWSKQGKPLRVSGTSRNITAIKENEKQYKLIASAFQSSSDGAVVLDSDLGVVSINTALTEITGYGKEIIGKKLGTYLEKQQGKKDGAVIHFSDIRNSVFTSGSFEGELYVTDAHGGLMPIDLRVASVIHDDDESTHFVATFTNIKFRKEAESKLRQLANFDGLTGLPNRTQVLERLGKEVDLSRKNNSSMAVMFLDLDNFKNVNDGLGHSIGDELLLQVAGRLKNAIRKSDTVARFGGDEFIIGLFELNSTKNIVKVAENVLKKFRKPFHLNNIDLVVTTSIGIAIYPNDGNDVETLLRHADTAMYDAKSSGRNNFKFFTESMNLKVIDRASLEARLRRALLNEEFVLFFQPKFCLKSKKISGFEALIRWRDPEFGIVMPDEFIPLAEESGLIIDIGKIVLFSAIKQLREWHDKGFDQIHVAVNISALQFKDKGLVPLVVQGLKKYQLDAHFLELEITESTLMADMAHTQKTLNELRSLGVKLSLDDFGTGYSSLSYLKLFPINSLKIDRSFVKEMASDQRDASLVKSIIGLAHNLDVAVTGEGVESVEQLKLLRKLGAEEIQGFLLSKPLDEVAAREILGRNQSISQILAKDRNESKLGS